MADRARPWRLASGALSAAGTVLLPVGLVLVFLDADARWIYGVVALYACVEIIQEIVERQGARLAPQAMEALCASNPLSRRDRALIVSMLALAILAVTVGLATSLVGDPFLSSEVLVFLAVTAVGGGRRLVRVLRRNSWFAITRLPARR